MKKNYSTEKNLRKTCGKPAENLRKTCGINGNKSGEKLAENRPSVFSPSNLLEDLTAKI
jgi:hypothetical protein